jgi:hypothetical protein
MASAAISLYQHRRSSLVAIGMWRVNHFLLQIYSIYPPPPPAPTTGNSDWSESEANILKSEEWDLEDGCCVNTSRQKKGEI